MKVGIDVSSLVYGRGVSRYTANLTRGLLTACPDIELKLYGNSYGQEEKLASEIKALRVPNRKFRSFIQHYPQKILSLIWGWGFNPVNQIFDEKVDVFHSWDWLQPPDKDFALVSTIHDLAILKYPESAKKEVLTAHQKSWAILRERGAEIITVSESTRQDVIKMLGFPPYQVTTIYEALPVENMEIAENMTEEIYNQARLDLGLDELGLGKDGKPFIFFVGTREPRKNLARLIEAWQPLAEKIDLVIAGETGWDKSENTAAESFYKPRFLGRISNEQLAVLYNEAAFFAYPSLDEGFGLPILESFYFGTPVLTSNLSAMKEIAGEAAMLVDPTDIQSICQGMVALLNEDENARHRRLQLMLLRQRVFSWEKTALQTAEVYHKALYFQKEGKLKT